MNILRLAFKSNPKQASKILGKITSSDKKISKLTSKLQNIIIMDKVKLINAGLAIDDRGELMFSNEFDMSKIKKFLSNNDHLKFVRAWSPKGKNSF